MSELRKKQEYKEFRPVGTYDVAALESWLEERARDGYRLLRFQGLYGIFHWEGAAPCRYRLQPLLRKECQPGREMLEIYQEMGWEYVCTLAGTFHVWRCEDPNVPELDTDPVVQGMGYSYLRRKMLFHLVRLPGVILLMLVIFVFPWILGVGDTPLIHQLQRALPGEWIFWVILLGGVFFLEGLDVRRMHRLLRSLYAGVPLKRPRSWRRQKRVTQVMLVLTWAGIVVSLLLPSGGDPHFTRSAMAGEDEPLPEVVYADLRELESTEELIHFSARRKSLLPAPRMYWTYQTIDGPDGEFSVYGNTSYYAMQTENLALRVETELRTWQEWFGGGEGEWLEVPGLDSFWWAGDDPPSQRDDPCQCVVARRGNCVLMFSYTGKKDLRSVSGYFAELLAET